MPFVRTLSTSVAASAILAWSGSALAQQASPTGKGVIGGALLGAELVLSLEAAFDVQSTWAYIGGGLAGGVAGGVGGYFIERESSSARLPMLMLAGGMAFAIPTTVAVLSATAYEPPASYIQDQAPPADEPIADPPRPVSAPPPLSGKAHERRRTAERKLAHPPALLDFEPHRVTLSVPSFSLHEVFTREEVATLGVKQATEVRVPVVHVLF